MAERSTRDPFSWEELAANMQQKYLNLFGHYDWDSYEYCEREYLEKRVGFGLFGPPPELPFTVVEKIAEALMKGDIRMFTLYLPKTDFTRLRDKGYEFVRDKVRRDFFTFANQKEKEIIEQVCKSVLFNEKNDFLNCLYFSEIDWVVLTKALRVFFEQQVAWVLKGGEDITKGYTTKQNEIIQKVCKALLTPNKKEFLLYLTESTWFSCQDAARKLLMEKIGRIRFGPKPFGYKGKEKDSLEELCDAILEGDKDKLSSLWRPHEWNKCQAYLLELYKEKVGNSLFGPPGKLLLKKENQTGYTAKQYEGIQKVCSAIIQEDSHGQSAQGETYMNMIFVCLEVKMDTSSHVLPITVFRVPRDSKGSAHFIDSNARVYKTWDDFLENNDLPECKYCYPRNGVYQTDEDGCVLVDFGKTPACKITKKALNVMDHANTGIMVGSLVVSAAALFVPVAGPLLAAAAITTGASGAYSIGRGSAVLIDRAQHKQSIGLEDSDARSCWLTIMGSAFGVASMGATAALTSMTQAGRVIGAAGRLTTTALQLSSLTVNGLGIVHGAYMLHTKYQEGELTSLDIFQFSASVLFFTHSAINFKTADTIIKETQTDAIQKYQDNLRSNRHRKVFRKVMKNTQKDLNPVEGRAQVIRALRQIDNKDDFFAGLVRSDKDFRKAKCTVKFVDGGLVEINGELKIDPMKFSEVNKKQRQIILNATKKLAQGFTSRTEFMTIADPILTPCEIPLTEVEIKECTSSVRDLMNGNNFPEISADGRSIMRLTVLYEVINIAQILAKFDRDLHLQLLEVAARLSNILGWTTSGKFVEVLRFVCNTVYRVASEIDQKYKEDLERAKQEAGSSFDQETFDRKYNINGKRFECFCFMVLEQYVEHPMMLCALKEAYVLGKSYFSNDNGTCAPSDLVSQSSASHPILKYTKENRFLKIRQFLVDEDIITLTENEIFDIVQEVTDLLVDSTNCVLQYGATDIFARVIVPYGPVTYVNIVSNFEDGFVSAYAYYDN